MHSHKWKRNQETIHRTFDNVYAMLTKLDPYWYFRDTMYYSSHVAEILRSDPQNIEMFEHYLLEKYGSNWRELSKYTLDDSPFWYENL